MNLTRPIGRAGALALVVACTAAGTAGAADRTGTAGPDRIKGSPSADKISSLGGDDVIAGRRGSDRLYAGGGADQVGAGHGADRVYGGAGDDKLGGEEGDDRILGQAGNDRIYAGAGRDVIEGGDGDDQLFAKIRFDRKGRVDRKGDRVRGGAGNDRIDTRDGEVDRITCGAGEDVAVVDRRDRITDATSSNRNGSCEKVERRPVPQEPKEPTPRADQAISWALQQRGTCEQPKGSNRGPKIDAWQQRAGGFSAVAWCGIFVHEAYLQAGLDLDSGIASTNLIGQWAEEGSHQLHEIRKTKLRKGDLFQIDDNPGDSDPNTHVGMVVSAPKNGKVRTIEGNWGDCVTSNDRPLSEIVQAVRVG